MNRWTLGGLLFGSTALFGASYLNSRVNLPSWTFDGVWWHLPVAVSVLAAVVVCWAALMAAGTMTSIYGQGCRKRPKP